MLLLLDRRAGDLVVDRVAAGVPGLPGPVDLLPSLELPFGGLLPVGVPAAPAPVFQVILETAGLLLLPVVVAERPRTLTLPRAERTVLLTLPVLHPVGPGASLQPVLVIPLGDLLPLLVPHRPPTLTRAVDRL